MIVSKEHLVRTMRHAYGTVPFLPVTYDLSYPEQLEGFVADFAARSKRNGGDESEANGIGNGGETVDNIWIMKRYRGRQSMDYPVSDSLCTTITIIIATTTGGHTRQPQPQPQR